MIKELTFTSLICIALAANWCCDPPTDHQLMLDLVVADNNHDGDGYVSVADVRYDLATFYDTDPKDGKVTVYEWVKRRNCRYDESYEYAEWLYNLLVSRPAAAGVMDTKTFPGPGFSPGFNLSEFRRLYDVVRTCQRSIQ